MHELKCYKRAIKLAEVYKDKKIPQQTARFIARAVKAQQSYTESMRLLSFLR